MSRTPLEIIPKPKYRSWSFPRGKEMLRGFKAENFPGGESEPTRSQRPGEQEFSKAGPHVH